MLRAISAKRAATALVVGDCRFDQAGGYARRRVTAEPRSTAVWDRDGDVVEEETLRVSWALLARPCFAYSGRRREFAGPGS